MPHYDADDELNVPTTKTWPLLLISTSPNLGTSNVNNAGEIASDPSAKSTVTGSHPVPGWLVARRRVSETKVTLGAAVTPKSTWVASVNPSPAISTIVPR